MSPSTSTASGRSSSRTRAWKQVYSLAVKALNSPPTASSATEMSSADALGGALEEQVLEEVRAAVQGRGLVARADVDPHADARRAGAGHLLGDDPQAAGQDRTPYARGHLAVGVLDGLEGAGGAVLLHGVLPGERGATGQQSVPAGRSIRCVDRSIRSLGVGRPRRLGDLARRRQPLGSRRRPGPATACRGRRSRRSRPGSSGPPRATSSTASTRLPPARARSLLMCSRPSLPGMSETNAPKLVVFTTVPR